MKYLEATLPLVILLLNSAIKNPRSKAAARVWLYVSRLRDVCDQFLFVVPEPDSAMTRSMQKQLLAARRELAVLADDY